MMRRIHIQKPSAACLHSHQYPHAHKQQQLPCLHCSPHDFIRMVHHLIERCIVFGMGRDECIITLANHANINPIITSTVWEELLKENTAFFQAYLRRPFIETNALNGQSQETSSGRTRRS